MIALHLASSLESERITRIERAYLGWKPSALAIELYPHRLLGQPGATQEPPCITVLHPNSGGMTGVEPARPEGL